MLRLRLPDGIFFTIVSGYKLIKGGHRSNKLKVVKSKMYLCSLNVKTKKVEILREANKEEK